MRRKTARIGFPGVIGSGKSEERLEVTGVNVKDGKKPTKAQAETGLWGCESMEHGRRETSHQWRGKAAAAVGTFLGRRKQSLPAPLPQTSYHFSTPVRAHD